MEKNKIPNRRSESNYLPELDFLTGSLIIISDRDYQLRVWYRNEGPEVFWYEECILCFDYEIDYFRHLLRTKQIHLASEQIKAILRLHAMSNTFWRNSVFPDGFQEEQLYVINHPYWEKIRKQAAYALSLLRRPT